MEIRQHIYVWLQHHATLQIHVRIQQQEHVWLQRHAQAEHGGIRQITCVRVVLQVVRLVLPRQLPVESASS